MAADKRTVAEVEHELDRARRATDLGLPSAPTSADIAALEGELADLATVSEKATAKRSAAAKKAAKSKSAAKSK
jgi:hypothetical protein